MPMTDSPYTHCTLCPRMCGTDRSRDRRGFCGESAEIRAACALLHFGEEPPITGQGGSGTVFFTGCTLRCGFCQNCQVSREGLGATLGSGELARIFLRLQEAGAENVNIVTGTQFVPGILEALGAARAGGLSIPLVWNSSGYESREMVEALSGHVGFFLPDLKTLDPLLSSRWFHAVDYPDRAAEAILAMADAAPLSYEEDKPIRGVILRHLVLPGNLDDTRAVLSWYKKNLDGRALISLLFQYTPIPGKELEAPLDRMISMDEYGEALDMLDELSIEDGYFQEPETDGEWLPDFAKPRPFPSGESRVIWHWMDGKP